MKVLVIRLFWHLYSRRHEESCFLNLILHVIIISWSKWSRVSCKEDKKLLISFLGFLDPFGSKCLADMLIQLWTGGKSKHDVCFMEQMIMHSSSTLKLVLYILFLLRFWDHYLSKDLSSIAIWIWPILVSILKGSLINCFSGCLFSIWWP